MKNKYFPPTLVVCEVTIENQIAATSASLQFIGDSDEASPNVNDWIEVRVIPDSEHEL